MDGLSGSLNAGLVGSGAALRQLQAIFNASFYTGCQDDEAGYAKPGPNVIRRGRFWVLLLSLWTAMRLGECCQLRVDDVTKLDGVPVIRHVSSRDARAQGREVSPRGG